MAGNLWQSWGGAALPHTADDVDDTQLVITDPAQALFVALFKAAINGDHVGAWTKVCAALPTTKPAHPLLNSTTPVADTLEVLPTPTVMRERKATFPLLAVHRFGEGTPEQHTMHRRQWRQGWLIHYLLGPRHSFADDRKLLPIFPRIVGTLIGTIDDKSHPNYEGGAVQFYGATLDAPQIIGSIKPGKFQSGEASFGSGDDKDPVYHALTMGMETTEALTDNVLAYPVVTGMEMSLSVGDRTELVRDLIVADTDFPGPMFEL